MKSYNPAKALSLPKLLLLIGLIQVLFGTCAIGRDPVTAGYRSVLVAVRVDSSPALSAEIEVISHRDGQNYIDRFSQEVPGETELHLQSSELWRLRAVADGYWSPFVEWDGSEAIVALRMQPTAELFGRLIPPDHASSRPEAMTLSFMEISSKADDLPLEGTVNCHVKDLFWQCHVPLGRWDIRARVEGYSVIYLWDTTVRRGKNPIEVPLRLVAGSSVAGWIASEGSWSKGEMPALVEIAPLRLSNLPDVKGDRRAKFLDTEVKSDIRGFFQIEGLSVGTYSLRARLGNHSSETRRISIDRADQDVLIEEPFLLLPPVEVEIFLEPQVDPWQQPWSVELAAVHEGNLEPAGTHQASLAGYWSRADLKPGLHNLRILDSQGSTWLSENHHFSSDGASFFFKIDVVPVRGHVRWRDSGLKGEVIFGTTNGSRSIRMPSDEDGQFEGTLPTEGAWELELAIEGFAGAQAIEPVEIRRRPGKSFAEVDLELPSTRLEGAVLEAGQPVAAWVVAIREEEDQDPSAGSGVKSKRRKEFFVETGKDGRFLLRGLYPGPIRVQAYTHTSASEWAVADLREDFDHPELVLELHKKIMLEGRIMTPAGGAAGATIVSLPSAGLIPDTQSGPAGHFRIELQKNAVFVDLIILPPSSGLTFRRVHLRGVSRDDLIVQTPSDTGDLAILINSFQFGNLHLHYGEVAVSVEYLLGMLAPIGRLSSRPDAGLVFHGLSPGSWSLCPGKAFEAEQCTTADVSTGQEARLQLP